MATKLYELLQDTGTIDYERFISIRAFYTEKINISDLGTRLHGCAGLLLRSQESPKIHQNLAFRTP